LHKFVAYDQSRQHLYPTDHVDVFDLNAQAYLSPIEPPPNGPLPDADLRGVGLTPDSSELIIADFGAQSVYLIDPDAAQYNGTVVPVRGVARFSSSGPARVTATSSQTVFVGPTQPEVSALTGTPLLQADAAGDVGYLAYDTAPGGPVALWNAATPNSFSLSSANDTAMDLVTSGDATIFAMRAANATEIRGPNLSCSPHPLLPNSKI
jgi:hypothetical protein